MPFLPPNQQRQSTDGKFLTTPTLLTTGNFQGGFLQHQGLGAVIKDFA